MTERAWGIIAATAGTVLVTLLMLRGVDLACAARTGPRWRRRLVVAGLAALTACGVQAESLEPPDVTTTCYAPPPMVTCYDVAVMPLTTGQGAVASLRVQYNLLEEQVQAGNVNTDTAQIAMRTMEGELQRLTDKTTFATIPEEEQAEARLTVSDAQVLLKQVQARRAELAAFPPPPPPAPTCYVMPMPVSIGQDAVMRLSLQTAFLREQLEQRTVTTDTAQVIMRTVENDLRALADTQVFGSIPEAEQAAARDEIRAAQKALGELRTMLREQALADNSEWCEYLDVYAELKMIAANERGSYPFDAAGKKALLAQADDARQALDGLAKGGLLTLPEAELLKQDLAEVRDKVQAYRTREMEITPMVPCYAPMPLRHPAELSMTRVNDRIALLRQLAAQQTVAENVIRPVIDELRLDIAVLNSPTNLQGLPEGQRAAAATARRAAERALADIELKLPAGE